MLSFILAHFAKMALYCALEKWGRMKKKTGQDLRRKRAYVITSAQRTSTFIALNWILVSGEFLLRRCQHLSESIKMKMNNFLVRRLIPCGVVGSFHDVKA